MCGCEPPSLLLPVPPQPYCSAPPSLHPFPSLSSFPHYFFPASLISSQSSSTTNQDHCPVASICRAALQFHFEVIIHYSLLRHYQTPSLCTYKVKLGIAGASDHRLRDGPFVKSQPKKMCTLTCMNAHAQLTAWQRPGVHGEESKTSEFFFFLLYKTCQPSFRLSQEVFLLSNQIFFSHRK